VKSFVVILAALVFLIVAAAHGYRIYAAVPVSIAGHALPVIVSWYGAAGSALLAVLLLIFARK
jgi:hypothetical protein